MDQRGRGQAKIVEEAEEAEEKRRKSGFLHIDTYLQFLAKESGRWVGGVSEEKGEN